MHALGKLLGLLVVGQLALHPNGVAVGGVGDGAVDAAVAAALEAVVALAGARRVPVKVDVGPEDVAGDGARLRVGQLLARDAGLVLRREALGVAEGAGRDGIQHRLVEALEARLGQPAVLDGLELLADLALALGHHHELREGCELGVGGTEDEGVVARVDGRGDERRGLSICAGNGEEVGAWRWLGHAVRGGSRKMGTYP